MGITVPAFFGEGGLRARGPDIRGLSCFFSVPTRSWHIIRGFFPKRHIFFLFVMPRCLLLPDTRPVVAALRNPTALLSINLHPFMSVQPLKDTVDSLMAEGKLFVVDHELLKVGVVAVALSVVRWLYGDGLWRREMVPLPAFSR